MHAVLAIAIAIILTLAAPAHAQDWPQRPVTIVVPFAAGGSADLLARILQQHMQVKFGVPFVVENRSGAGGSIGTGVVAKAPPDGYTLLLGTLSGNVINGFFYTKLPYDVERDFQPVSLLVHLPNLLVVNTKLSAKTVPELISHLKASDGKVNYGSSGNGTSSHLSAVMFQLASGTKMTHVPFRSTADELNSMVGGHIDLAIDSMTTLWPQAQAGVEPVEAPERSWGRKISKLLQCTAKRKSKFQIWSVIQPCVLKPIARSSRITKRRSFMSLARQVWQITPGI
jgi:tripartite-type tricarboxylate transporter receptor subunit TctC